MVNPDRVASDDNAAALLTVTMYVCVVTPSAAVTIVVITLFPMDKLIGNEAFPLDTTTPFTIIVAFGSSAVGVTVMLTTVVLTAAV